MINSANTQNLVLNSSFEDFKKCPESISEKKLRLKGKIQSVKRTPDYFNTCSKTFSPRNNPMGYQAPYHGEAFCGLVLTYDFVNECSKREYLELKLKEPLIPGKKYLFSIQVSLADKSGYYTDQIGAIFNQKSIAKAKNINSLLQDPDINNPLNRFIADTSNWTEVSGVYNAKGGEEYLVIGNFQRCNQTTRKTLIPNDSSGVMKNLKRKLEEDLAKAASLYSKKQLKKNPPAAAGLRLYDYAYYFIDQVSLTPYTLNDSVEFLSQEEACTITPDQHATENAKALLDDGSFNLNQEGSNPYWKNASKGTPDFLDDQIGLYLFSDLGKNNREYIIAPLKKELHPCNRYFFSLRLKRNKKYRFMVDHIEAAFIDSTYYQNNRLIFPFQADFQSPPLKIIDKQDSWITICGEFSPSSCANYVVIGNFTSDQETYILPDLNDTQGGPFAYYFIDDVVLYQTDTINNCNTTCTDDSLVAQVETPTIKKTRPIEFRSDSLHFFFKIAQTSPISIDSIALKKLGVQLTQNPELALVVEGHTDNTGTDLINNTLSKQRAEAIIQFLVKNGINRSRIRLRFFGSKRPMATNLSAEGRQQNRRVILFTTKAP